MRKPELLSPAGDYERLEFAALYGADAVYIGGEAYGMRTAGKNFSIDEMTKAAEYLHGQGKKLYLTLNTVPTNAEADLLPEYVALAAKTGVDAFIVAEIGVLAAVKKYAPDMEIHLSTQVGIMNYATARAAYDLGAKRVVLAREMDLEQIKILRDKTPPDLEIEAFVHGAMCMSFSGRCLLSHYLTGRDANRGMCAQPCRWEWQISLPENEERRYTVGQEKDGGSFILNADDLCTAEFIDKVCAAGVDSLKIEGRAKSFYYVASVTAAYRAAVDEYLKGGKYRCPQSVKDELLKTSHRRYSPGFYFGAQNAVQNTKTGGYYRDWDVMSVVEKCENGRVYCTQRGKFTQGDTLEALLPSGEVLTLVPQDLRDENGDSITATPCAMMKFSFTAQGLSNDKLMPKSILRKKI